MIYLLTAVLICLLVPWLPALMYRLLPRRPAPPLSEEQLHGLAQQLHQEQPQAPVEVLPVEDGPTSTDVTRRPVAIPAAPKPGNKDEGIEGQKRPAASIDHDETEGEEGVTHLALPSYRWLNCLGGPVFIVGFLALGFGWAMLLHYLGEEHARSFPPAVFLFKPFVYGFIFAVPALFLGIFSSIFLLTLLGRLLMGRRKFLEYLHWDEGRLGSQRVGRMIQTMSVFSLIVGIPSAAFVGLGMNWYTRFAEDRIAVKPLFAFAEEVHPYDEVEQIVVTSHRRQGKDILSEPELGIRFRGGETWTTGQTFRMPADPAERDRFLGFLSRKTGKPITRARLLSDQPGW